MISLGIISFIPQGIIIIIEATRDTEGGPVFLYPDFEEFRVIIGVVNLMINVNIMVNMMINFNIMVNMMINVNIMVNMVINISMIVCLMININVIVIPMINLVNLCGTVPMNFCPH